MDATARSLLEKYRWFFVLRQECLAFHAPSLVRCRSCYPPWTVFASPEKPTNQAWALRLFKSFRFEVVARFMNPCQSLGFSQKARTVVRADKQQVRANLVQLQVCLGWAWIGSFLGGWQVCAGKMLAKQCRYFSETLYVYSLLMIAAQTLKQIKWFSFSRLSR